MWQVLYTYFHRIESVEFIYDNHEQTFLPTLPAHFEHFRKTNANSGGGELFQYRAHVVSPNVDARFPPAIFEWMVKKFLSHDLDAMKLSRHARRPLDTRDKRDVWFNVARLINAAVDRTSLSRASWGIEFLRCSLSFGYRSDRTIEHKGFVRELSGIWPAVILQLSAGTPPRVSPLSIFVQTLMRTLSHWSRFTIASLPGSVSGTRRIAYLPVSRRDEGANDRYQYEETASDHAYHANGPARSVRRCVRNRQKRFKRFVITSD